jgi:hypothetical protein
MANGTTTAKRTAKGYRLICPECGADDSALRIDLNDLRGGEVTCSNCDLELTVDQIVKRLTEQLTRWQKVQRWIELAQEVIQGDDSTIEFSADEIETYTGPVRG